MTLSDLALLRIALGIFLLIAGLGSFQPGTAAQEYKGTSEQRMACAPDVWRLCSEQVPDVSRIVSCLRQNTTRLSSGCRAVFEAEASAQQQPATGTTRQPKMRARSEAPPAANAPVGFYSDEY